MICITTDMDTVFKVSVLLASVTYDLAIVLEILNVTEVFLRSRLGLTCRQTETSNNILRTNVQKLPYVSFYDP